MVGTLTQCSPRARPRPRFQCESRSGLNLEEGRRGGAVILERPGNQVQVHRRVGRELVLRAAQHKDLKPKRRFIATCSLKDHTGSQVASLFDD